MFLSGAVVAIDEFSIRVEVPHHDFAMIRSHGAERTNQAAAGTCFGCGLCRQQVCAGTVLAEEGRQHVSGVADLPDQIGDIVKLVLALLIGFLHHADFRLGKTVILLVLLLHLLVELVEVTLRIGDWLQISCPSAPERLASASCCTAVVNDGSVCCARLSTTSVMPCTVAMSLPTNGIFAATFHSEPCAIWACAVCC